MSEKKEYSAGAVKNWFQNLDTPDTPANETELSTVEALEKLLLPEIDTQQRKKFLEVLGTGEDNANLQEQQWKVTSMHRALANKFQEIGMEIKTDKDVLNMLLKDEHEKAEKDEKFLAYLCACGWGGFNILHTILNPTIYENNCFSIDAVKPLIRFLLHIHPDLPTGKSTDGKNQPPIFVALQTYRNSSNKTKDSNQTLEFKSSIKESIIRFLCETDDNGLGSKMAIRSLAQMVEGNKDSCNAIHKIISSADFKISEAVLTELRSIMISEGQHSGNEICCLETRDGQGRTCLHIALTAPLNERSIWWAERLSELLPDLLKATCPSAIKKQDNDKEQLTPLQYFAEQRSQKESDGELNLTLNDLEAFLKRQCLINFKIDTCKSIMYGKGAAKEIFLTLDDDIVSWESLESQKLHYKLDTSLKRVHISNSVSIHWDEFSLEARKIATGWKCAGNFDLFMVFFWLKHEIDVKKIIEVVVDDGAGGEESPSDGSEIDKKPHSDQAIIECLKGLAVEILNWKRMDIPAEVIIKGAGKDVRRLHLYCSGSQAVLQSWADSNGLSKLENGLESFDWVNEHAKEFAADLKKKFEELNPGKTPLVVDYKIIRPKKALGAKSAESEVKNRDQQGFEEQDWLKCMDEFADIMEAVEQQPDSASKDIQKSTHPIRVALIDDGVKTSYAGLDNNIHTGRSGWQQPDSPTIQTENSQWEHFRGYNSSHTGHGTVMAYYIKRVCPRVSLYVAKLDCKPRRGGAGGGSENVTFSLDSVAQAIEWAVEQEVDIISMSWAIEKGSTPPYKPLRDAIEKAVEKNIILFCANPDNGTGYIDNGTYPWSLDNAHIICVGAATQSGVRWNQIDAKDGSCKYFFPGVELGIQVETKQRRNPDGPPREWRTHSGSSLSCALAAGLAAMILHCSLVTGVATFGSRKWEWLRSHKGICSAFDRIQVDKMASGWLPVRRFFGPVVANPSEDSDSKAQAIQSLIKDIFQGMPSH
ncbi:uncharacterized protein Triagg1_1229 [Trichoderma aggressivum f. europaeum]|uniref:Peptidase S8/S53 domain-containing protein n=1 Tax=Trichoderma aggressivum f. europaeum TaxID=173218 RepID=A0AAE1IJC6_9HYPO|nr:hypothetical protein Triagg1_1229 [Trichoderma aggressivum f. europaeum]